MAVYMFYVEAATIDETVKSSDSPSRGAFIYSEQEGFWCWYQADSTVSPLTQQTLQRSCAAVDSHSKVRMKCNRSE